ncbi:MAG: glycogen synthase [Dehalococcoidia bacterium]|nr:glycogen synthase [Dehalococcoidia bacterium]
MKILFAAAEIAPLTKVGGLADVVGSLPVELIRRGHDVRVVVPKYGFVDYSGYVATTVIDGLPVLSMGVCRKTTVEQISIDGLSVYLVDTDIFKKADSVYGTDEVEKFWVFCDCVSELLCRMEWHPSIVHCHDWHTALIPLLARKNHVDYRTVFTIHNIKYQGYFNERMLSLSGLEQYWNAGIPGMPYLPWNIMTQGILWADVVNAVSEKFASEILTVDSGYGMQDILKYRKGRLSGVINGLGTEEYDPGNDGLIAANFRIDDMEGKQVNKKELQNNAGWEENAEIPLVGMVARLDEQKGMDIILEAVPLVLKNNDVRFVFLGSGNENYEEALRGLEAKYPGNVKALITFDNAVAHLIYAGSDLFLMPSKWEPCGLGQMIAMRYGTVPVVRRTGGLADTVTNLSHDMKRGTGLVFSEYSGDELAAALKRAIELYANKTGWKRVMERIMRQDFSWQGPAEKYELLYKKALGLEIDESSR